MRKLSKKVMSIALAIAVAASSAFSGSGTAQAETASSSSDKYAPATLTVKFKRPKDSTSTPKIYAYDREVDANGNEKEGTSQALAGQKSPYQLADMTLDTSSDSKDWYTCDLNTRHGFAYVIIECGDKRYPEKKDVTDNAFRITSSVTIDATQGSNATPVPTVTSTPAVTNTPTPSNSGDNFAPATLTVKFKRATNSTSTPKIYAYDREVKDGKEVSGTSQALAGQKSPYKLADMTLDTSSDSKDWYTCTLNTRHGFAYVVIECGDKRYPEKKDVTDNAFRITSSVTIDATQSDVKPVATTFPTVTSTPTATATVTPSTTPTVTATAIASATPTATVEASATPSVTPTTSADVTVAPTTTPTEVPTSSAPAVTDEPNITSVPTVEPTTDPGNQTPATEIPTVAPTTTPDTTTATQTPQATTNAAVNVKDDQNAATNVSGAAVTGSVIFAKKGKTAGEDVTIKIVTTNKKSNAKYTYSYYVGSKAIAKKTSKTSVTWTTSTKGTYAVKVIIYENGVQTAVASAKYTVKARVITIKSLKTNKKSGQKKNTKITITATATTKKGKVSYKFAVQKGSGAIKTIKNYSKKGKATWKPTKKGTYKLYVYVKNGKGVVVKKTKTFKVK